MNKLTQTFGPKLVKTIHKAALGYIEWKQQQSNPRLMPWRYPEQMQVPRISIADVSMLEICGGWGRLYHIQSSSSGDTVFHSDLLFRVITNFNGGFS